MLVKIQPKTEDEWKNCRKNGIGSSDVGTILNKNKFETFHTWWEYRTGRLEEKEMNDAMVRGHCMEDAVAQMFAHKTKSKIIGASAANIIYYDDEHPWRRATPDRFCWKPGCPKDATNMKNKFILECKTYRGAIKDGKYPNMYYYQVMYQLGICGCDYAYLAWVDSSLECDFVRIDFNQEIFDDICLAVDTVWEYNLGMDIEPSITSYEDLIRKFSKEEEGKKVEFSIELANKVEELRQVKESIKGLEDKEKEIKTEIAIAMEDAEIAVDAAGVPLLSFKASRRFDPSAVESKNLELYHQYLVRQPDKFDADAFKKDVGNKVYKEFCTAIGPRTLKLK